MISANEKGRDTIRDHVRHSVGCDNLKILVENLQLLNLFHIALRHVAIANIQPLEFMQSQQDLCDDLSRDLIRHQAQLLQLQTVPTLIHDKYLTIAKNASLFNPVLPTNNSSKSLRYFPIDCPPFPFS
jgi:hypothetical protein